MNIIEAHKSGRAFKRPTWTCWGTVHVGNAQARVVFRREAPLNWIDLPLSQEDLLADDYILEPEAKLLTREQIVQLLEYPTTYLHESGVTIINMKRYAEDLDKLFS